MVDNETKIEVGAQNVENSVIAENIAKLETENKEIEQEIEQEISEKPTIDFGQFAEKLFILTESIDSVNCNAKELGKLFRLAYGRAIYQNDFNYVRFIKDMAKDNILIKSLYGNCQKWFNKTIKINEKSIEIDTSKAKIIFDSIKRQFTTAMFTVPVKTKIENDAPYTAANFKQSIFNTLKKGAKKEIDLSFIKILFSRLNDMLDGVNTHKDLLNWIENETKNKTTNTTIEALRKKFNVK